MCDQLTQDAILDVVDEFCTDEKLFTALDVSREVQDRLVKSNKFDKNNHRHLALRKDIHDQCDQWIKSGFYNKTLKDVGGHRAFVYHPFFDNTVNYQNQQKSAVPTTVLSPPSVKVYNVDKRGTLCIPATFVRSVGFKCLSTVDIDFLNKSIKISQGVLKSSNCVTQYTVDAYSNIRICKTTLALLQAKNGYEISIDGKEIVVKAH